MAIVSLLLDNLILQTQVIPDSNIHIDGYLEGLTRHMLEENDDVISFSKGTPKIQVKLHGDEPQRPIYN